MAYKVFQNGYPLTASELNNYLMNQTVMVFASAAERTSVLTSPVEGMITWLQDTNAFQQYNGSAWVDVNDNTDAIQKSLLTTAGDTIYATGSATPARLALGSTGSLLKSNGTAPAWLGVGTSGQVLSSTGSDLAWTTPASGGGMTLLSTTTLSGTTTAINSISQAYKRLVILVTGVSLGTNEAAILRVRSGTTNHNFQLVGFNNSTTASTIAGPTFAFDCGSTANNSNRGGLLITIDNYSATGTLPNTQKPVSIYGMTNYVNAYYNFAGGLNSPEIGGVDSITFTGNSLQSFTNGTVKIYGVN